jgi:hypothetical protein
MIQFDKQVNILPVEQPYTLWMHFITWLRKQLHVSAYS